MPKDARARARLKAKAIHHRHSGEFYKAGAFCPCLVLHTKKGIPLGCLSRLELSVERTSAPGTGAVHDHVAAGGLKVVLLPTGSCKRLVHRKRHVAHLAALRTDRVTVRSHGRVEMTATARYGDLTEAIFLHQLAEIPVDRGQAELGPVGLEVVKDHLGRGMILLFVNDAIDDFLIFGTVHRRLFSASLIDPLLAGQWDLPVN